MAGIAQFGWAVYVLLMAVFVQSRRLLPQGFAPRAPGPPYPGWRLHNDGTVPWAGTPRDAPSPWFSAIEPRRVGVFVTLACLIGIALPCDVIKYDGGRPTVPP